MEIYVSEEADTDLLKIHAYIAERNLAAAVSLANAFEQKFANLTRFSIYRPGPVQSAAGYSECCGGNLCYLLQSRS